jgi:glycine C-acetyltransferase
VIDLLRQRARPYLFSNALPPAMVGAALTALDIIEQADDLRERLTDNATYWRAGLTAAGFTLLPGTRFPVMLGDASCTAGPPTSTSAASMSPSSSSRRPQGPARIRTQMNAPARDDLDFALNAFTKAGKAWSAEMTHCRMK